MRYVHPSNKALSSLIDNSPPLLISLNESTKGKAKGKVRSRQLTSISEKLSYQLGTLVTRLIRRGGNESNESKQSVLYM